MRVMDPLLMVLRDKTAIGRFSLADWDTLVRQARRANLLAHIATRIEALALGDAVPPAPRQHLDGARIQAAKHVREVQWEARSITLPLAAEGVPVIFLKGAAYQLAGLKAGEGRFFTDVDILVPKARLADTEMILMSQGYLSAKENDYDDQYYRKWMHELPPLRHVKRQTVIDVHHRILPITARWQPDPDLMLAAAKPIAWPQGARVLAPEDMVLHSAAHLFCDGALEHGLRDLVDLDALLREFGADAEFWGRLADRARTLDLERAYSYALRMTARVLGTPVPEESLAAAARAALPWPLARLMEAILTLAVLPPLLDGPRPGQKLTGFVLYLRSHWLRMPMRLLIPHLVRKAIRRMGQPREPAPAPGGA